jgi:hypothetical protein
MDATGYEPKPAVIKSPSMLPHKPPVWEPTDPIAPMMAIKMRANITAYSTAVAASSCRHSVWKKSLIAAPLDMPESAVGKDVEKCPIRKA